MDGFFVDAADVVGILGVEACKKYFSAVYCLRFDISIIVFFFRFHLDDATTPYRRWATGCIALKFILYFLHRESCDNSK